MGAIKVSGWKHLIPGISTRRIWSGTRARDRAAARLQGERTWTSSLMAHDGACTTAIPQITAMERSRATKEGATRQATCL